MADVLINILGDASKLKGELDKAGKNVTSFSDKVVKIGKVAAIAGAAVTAAFTAVVLKTASVGYTNSTMRAIVLMRRRPFLIQTDP